MGVPDGTVTEETVVPGSGIDFGTSVEANWEVVQLAAALAGVSSTNDATTAVARSPPRGIGRCVRADTIANPRVRLTDDPVNDAA
jgi:hypothetical protein